MGKKNIEVSSVMSGREVIALLQDLKAGFETGLVCVRKGSDHVALRPGERVSVEVEATIKKDKQKFVLEMSWREAEEPEERQPMRITTSEPSPLDAPAPEDGSVAGA